MNLFNRTAVKAAALLLFLAGISAAGVKYVAVVETEVDAQSGASAALNPAEVRQITAELRRQAAKNLPLGKYSVMTSETIQSMGGAVLEACSDENCVITLGSKIGADYIVRGIISKFQTKITLTVEMYETENGTLVATSEPVRSENIGELLDKVTAAGAEMYKEFAGKQGAAAQTLTQESDAARWSEQPQTQLRYAQETSPVQTRYRVAVNNRADDDFTTGERWKTFGLNLIPGGLGSFLIMKDNAGGYILLGANAVAVGGALISGFSRNDGGKVFGDVSFMIGFFGAGIFNIVRSATYHKPRSQMSAADDFKPYDGLKLAVVPTENGDFKVLARYDKSF